MKLGFSDTIFVLLAFGIFVLILTLACSNKADISGEVPPEVQELLEKLNSWNKEELDVLEHPDKYSGRIASGETKGWVDVHKQKLKELGFLAKWNSNKRIYEIVSCKN